MKFKIIPVILLALMTLLCSCKSGEEKVLESLYELEYQRLAYDTKGQLAVTTDFEQNEDYTKGDIVKYSIKIINMSNKKQSIAVIMPAAAFNTYTSYGVYTSNKSSVLEFDKDNGEYAKIVEFEPYETLVYNGELDVDSAYSALEQDGLLDNDSLTFYVRVNIIYEPEVNILDWSNAPGKSYMLIEEIPVKIKPVPENG